MLETRHLRTFRTIVETGSFTGAGEQLGLSQPAISQQVRQLEDELGLALLVRDGKITHPTPAGEVLLTYARQVLDKLVEAERVLAEHRRGSAGVVRLGLPEPPCNYVLPGVLALFKQQLPRIDVRVVTGHTASTLARLAAGELDVGLLPLPLEPGKLRVVEVGRDELVAVVPPDHRLAEQPWLLATELEDEPLVLYDRSSQITDLTLSFLLADGVFPRIAVEIDHLEAVKDLVRGGVGVAIMPAWAARREIQAGLLRPVRLGAAGLPRTWGVLHPEQQRLPAAVRALIQLLVRELPSRFDDGTAETPSTLASHRG